MPTAPLIDPRNANTLWASVLAETLRRCGVRRAVVSPGSRSAPLVIALVAHPEIETVPVLDERSAGFFALGLARQRGEPVALVCTSGTAAANFLPALVEAKEAGVPLLALTADRPPEMRACASGQTIDQQKLYGEHVNFFQELAVPEASEPRLRHLRQAVANAVERTLAPMAGPVHLNAPFRDPLAPIPDDGTAARLAGGIDWTRFFAHLETAAPASPPAGPIPQLAAEIKGAIIVGPVQPADPEAFASAVAEIARQLDWPVLADGLSPLRNQAGKLPGLVTTYDTVLRNERAAARLRPEAVLCVGTWPTSKVLRAWIEMSDPTVWMLTERPDNRDALHTRARAIKGSLAALAASLPDAVATSDYRRLWLEHERKARAELDARLAAETELFEPKAAWLLARHLPPGTPLCVANSMPARDVEYVWPAGDGGVRPLCNRGANGIDGTLSTALGSAHGAERPAVLLTGDLSLLHDANGFLLRPKLRGSLTVILINNRGGGIFEHLPVAAFEPPFEEFFATPQEVDFATLCAAHGVAHTLVRDWTHLAELVAALPAGGIRVLELRTDRKRDAAGRRRLFADVAASIG